MALAMEIGRKREETAMQISRGDFDSAEGAETPVFAQPRYTASSTAGL
jgi:hypothetical protein